MSWSLRGCLSSSEAQRQEPCEPSCPGHTRGHRGSPGCSAPQPGHGPSSCWARSTSSFLACLTLCRAVLPVPAWEKG